jgi:hypothetical protein
MSLGFTIDQSNKFNAIFAPLAKIIALELQKNNIHIFYSDQNISQKFPRLIFGAHTNPDFWLKNRNEMDIFVNFEPIFLQNWQINNFSYYKLLNSSRVFDYTTKGKNTITKGDFLPLPPLFESKENAHKDTEVLFVGSVNKRRQLVFKELSDNGINLSIKFNIFGKELYQQLQKSSIFFDTFYHYSEDSIFNIYRFCLCADTKTIYVGEAGDMSDYPEVEELLGLTITNNTYDFSKIIKNILSNKSRQQILLEIQKKIARKLRNKFEKFVSSFSKEFH